MKKSFFLVILCLLAGGITFAQHPIKPKISEQSWRILFKAQEAFNSGNYGDALALCENARKSRQKELEWNCWVMEYTLNAPEVKKHGPFISDLIPVLEGREDYDALEIINSWVDHKGASYFDNSLPKLYDYLKRLKEYPESDFLLARIYRLEGEYDLSMQFLQNAWQNAELLDVAAQKYDILYEMADLAKTKDDRKTYEDTLLLIVAQDGLFKDETMRRAMQKSVQLKRKDLVDYFFTLFRADAVNSIRAYLELGGLYSELKKSREAWNMTADGVVSAFTWINGILRDRSPEYSYTTLKDFFYECARYEDIMAWTQKNNVWKGFFFMAMFSRENGWTYFGNEMLGILSEACPDNYWKQASLETLLIK